MRWLRLGTLVLLAINFALVGMNAWNQHKISVRLAELRSGSAMSEVPPSIPCHNGMTLLPGQSCYGVMVIEIPGARPKDDSY